MEIPSHIELRTDWYFDTVRGKQIHPDQLQGYIARHRYDYMGYAVEKAVKVKKVKVKPAPKPPTEKPTPVKKPAKPKPVAKAKPVKKKTAPKRKRRPAKRKLEEVKPEPFKAGVIRDVTKEWLAKRNK